MIKHGPKNPMGLQKRFDPNERMTRRALLCKVGEYRVEASGS